MARSDFCFPRLFTFNNDVQHDIWSRELEEEKENCRSRDRGKYFVMRTDEDAGLAPNVAHA